MANAPFSADETQHYLRALGIRTDAMLVGPRIAHTGPIPWPKDREEKEAHACCAGPARDVTR